MKNSISNLKFSFCDTNSNAEAEGFCIIVFEFWVVKLLRVNFKDKTSMQDLSLH